MSVKSLQITSNHTGKNRYPTSEQSATLLTALNNHLTRNKPDQKPHQLTPPQAPKMTLIYHQHNITEEPLTPIFNVPQPTVCRTTTTIEKTLARALKSLMKPPGISTKSI